MKKTKMQQPAKPCPSPMEHADEDQLWRATRRLERVTEIVESIQERLERVISTLAAPQVQAASEERSCLPDTYPTNYAALWATCQETVSGICGCCGQVTHLHRMPVSSVLAIGGFRCAAQGCEFEIPERRCRRRRRIDGQQASPCGGRRRGEAGGTAAE